MKVVIGITSGWEPGTVVNDWPLVYVNKGLVESLEKAGAVPVIIPVLGGGGWQDYLSFVDGVVASGEVLSIKRNVMKDGGDNVLYNSNPLRYENEANVIKLAVARGIPVLGICRGYQVLNVEMGGTMKAGDITEGNEVMHQQGGIVPPWQGVHEVKIVPGTKLHRMLQVDQVLVNSFHRQAVERIPEGYVVRGVAPDGNIEAIEFAGEEFVMGLQFHPEMLPGEVWENFFQQFVAVVREHKSKSLNH